MTEFVVIVSPTIKDGTVVRWYRSLSAAEDRDQLATASRGGFRFPGLLRAADAELIDTVRDAHGSLATGRIDDVDKLATHRRVRSRLVAIDRDRAS